MATRSTIGMVRLTDGKINAIYCHWDGYPSNNGLCLYRNYNSHDGAWSLMLLGDLSSLRSKIGEKHDLFDLGGVENRGVTNDWCDAYGRDRGDDGYEMKTFDNIREFKKWSKGVGADYLYLFKNDDQWWVNSPYESTGFKKLEKVLVAEGVIDPIEELIEVAKKSQ